MHFFYIKARLHQIFTLVQISVIRLQRKNLRGRFRVFQPFTIRLTEIKFESSLILDQLAEVKSNLGSINHLALNIRTWIWLKDY